MDNYKTIEQKLKTLTPFKGNSLTAYWEGELYKVISYSTLIASTHSNGTFSVATRKYSVTTSRHQNLIKRAWGGVAGVI